MSDTMSDTEIEAMAVAAGMEDIFLDGSAFQSTNYKSVSNADLTKFAELVRAAERERAAKVADETVCDTHLPTGVRIYGRKAGAAIRALK